MKKTSIIYSILSLILVLLVVEGSTGITTVLHHCTSHGESSFISGLLPASETSADCCHHTDRAEGLNDNCCEHDSSQPAENNESTLNEHCCDYEFSNHRITYYLPSLKFEIITPDLQNALFSGILTIPEPVLPAYKGYILSKPGGRDIIKSTCILLS